MRVALVGFLCCAVTLARAQDGDRADAPAVRTPAAPVPETSAPIPAQPAARAVDPAALQRAFAALAREPSVERVIEAARAHAPHSRSEALAERARLAGWLPRLSLRARRGQAVDLSSIQDDESFKLSTDDDLTLEASLTFELDRVVFRREEVTLSRQAEVERRELAARIREVVSLYFERRRLQLQERLSGPLLERGTRIAEIEALLNIFTGGAFQRMIDPAKWTTEDGTGATRRRSSPRSTSATTP